MSLRQLDELKAEDEQGWGQLQYSRTNMFLEANVKLCEL